MIRVLVLAALLLLSPQARAERYSFALFGETPQSEQERLRLPAMMAEMARSGARFAVHVGDFQGSEDNCSDALFADRKALFAAAPLPLIHVPGAESWVDCYRRSAGAFDPNERLAALRRVFFAKPEAFGPGGMVLERQSEIAFEHAAFVEHLRWHRGPVLFVSLNLPGGDNDWGSARQGGAEYRTRMAAIRDWLERAFALAAQEKLRGIVLFTQANPDFEAYASGKAPDAFAEFFSCLRAGLTGYTGEVLIVHGDTHVMRIDHPLLDEHGAPLQRVTRIETYGSPLMGWIGVTVEPEAAELFHFDSHPQDED
ncbi:hypothetical protein [Niveibacterium terrae]|uniref:hypothetical protein n=1 Tax=Niveibacterium terrae TaxID=3373598 RepID=UPI003A93D1FB